jgi:c-di-GMP-binding flagellar brake protein YcgR
MSHNFRVHDLITIHTPGEHPASHRSRIEEVREERLIIAWPTENGVRIPVHEHETLRIAVSRKGSIFGFEAVVEALELAPLALITVHPQGPPRFIERREDVRVEARLPVTIGAKIVSISSYRQEPRNGAVIRTHTLTISAGGFTFKHNAGMTPGSPFDVSLLLPDDPKPLTLAAKVVRSDSLPSSEGGRFFEIGMAYLRLTESVRSRIVRYVFKSQASQSQ